MKRVWKDYGLAIVLFLLFAFSWLGQGISQWAEFKSDQAAHQQPAEVSEFLPEFWQATLENWQSEFLQLFTFVVLTAYLMYRGSPESKDSDEKMEAALARVEKRLDAMERSMNGQDQKRKAKAGSK